MYEKLVIEQGLRLLEEKWVVIIGYFLEAIFVL
jgi:hypothetical protein